MEPPNIMTKETIISNFNKILLICLDHTSKICHEHSDQIILLRTYYNYCLFFDKTLPMQYFINCFYQHKKVIMTKSFKKIEKVIEIGPAYTDNYSDNEKLIVEQIFGFFKIWYYLNDDNKQMFIEYIIELYNCCDMYLTLYFSQKKNLLENNT